MVSCNKPISIALALNALVLPLSNARGRGNTRGGSNNEEQNIIQNLVANRHLINRNVEKTKDGILASTWSLEENVSGWLKTHVQQMKALIESDDGVIRQWDDLFREAFAMRDFHHMKVNYTDDGVEVEHSGDNDCAKAIVQAHAKVVSHFIKRGRAEIWRNHQVPEECTEK